MIAIIVLLALILIGILSANFWLIGILGVIAQKNSLSQSKSAVIQNLERLREGE
jgi:hypothetical protein